MGCLREQENISNERHRELEQTVNALKLSNQLDQTIDALELSNHEVKGLEAENGNMEKELNESHQRESCLLKEQHELERMNGDLMRENLELRLLLRSKAVVKVSEVNFNGSQRKTRNSSLVDSNNTMTTWASAEESTDGDFADLWP